MFWGEGVAAITFWNFQAFWLARVYVTLNKKLALIQDSQSKDLCIWELSLTTNSYLYEFFIYSPLSL